MPKHSNQNIQKRSKTTANSKKSDSISPPDHGVPSEVEEHEVVSDHSSSSSATNYMEDRNVSLKLQPTDRVLELAHVLNLAKLNAKQQVNEKPFLPYSPQVFGSGKTFFGIHAVEIFSNEHDALQKSLRELEWTEEEIAEYKDMRLVFIDLSNFLYKWILCSNITFRTAFFLELYMEATQTKIPSSFAYSEETIMNKIMEATGHVGKFFIFVDEIGALQDFKYYFPELTDLQNTKSPYHDEYRALFQVLLPLLKHPNVVCFCAGKSGRLTQRASEDSQSPVRLTLLMLSPFEDKNIKDIIKGTIYKDRYLDDLLQIPPNHLDEFCKQVIKYTGGIPRLIQRTLEHLLWKKPSLKTPEQIDSALMELSSFIENDTSAFFAPSILENNDRNVYNMFLTLRAMNLSFPNDGKIKIEGDYKSIVDLATNLCIYLRRSKSKQNHLKPVFGKYILNYLERYPLDDRMASLSYLLIRLQELPQMLDQGRFFELLLAQELVSQLSFCNTFGELTPLKDCFLAKENVFNLRLDIVPSFSVNANGKNVKTKTYNINYWSKFLSDLPPNVIGIPGVKSSCGPYIIGKFGRPISVILCIAAKNFQAETSLSWANIQEEINKSIGCIAEQVKDQNALLVVAATKRMQEIEDCIGSSRLLEEGYWFYNKCTKALVCHRNRNSKDPKKGWDRVLEVPEKTQVLILGERGMEQLLGDKTLKQLKQYFSPHSKQDVDALFTCFQGLDSVESSFEVPVTKRKREADDSPVPVVGTSSQSTGQNMSSTKRSRKNTTDGSAGSNSVSKNYEKELKILEKQLKVIKARKEKIKKENEKMKKKNEKMKKENEKMHQETLRMELELQGKRRGKSNR